MTKKTKRHEHILEALEIDPTMRVNELSQRLEVSSETIRRDLRELDAMGSLKRTYGGAVRTSSAFEPDLAERMKLHIHQRERIARHAVSLLEDVTGLYIGGGATTLHFARSLRSWKRRLTVFTASFGIATELSANPQIEVIFLPGRVESREGLVVGPETLDYISRYRTPISIMGASGIDEAGVSEALINSAQVYEAMIRNSDRTFVVADSSKFGSRSLRTIATWGPNTKLLTDEYPGQLIANAIERAGGFWSVAP